MYFDIKQFEIHPDTGISNKACPSRYGYLQQGASLAILNSFVNDTFERIATEAFQ
jgi:hypothetical protein